jgi:hypothetical protein
MKLMPDINIFILSQVPDKKEKKVNPLAEALMSGRHEEMMGIMSQIAEKLKRLPMTSHAGGG